MIKIKDILVSEILHERVVKAQLNSTQENDSTKVTQQIKNSVSSIIWHFVKGKNGPSTG